VLARENQAQGNDAVVEEEAQAMGQRCCQRCFADPAGATNGHNPFLVVNEEPGQLVQFLLAADKGAGCVIWGVQGADCGARRFNGRRGLVLVPNRRFRPLVAPRQVEYRYSPRQRLITPMTLKLEARPIEGLRRMETGSQKPIEGASDRCCRFVKY
jgi:hypothetical protein